MIAKPTTLTAHADGPVLVEYGINKEPFRAVGAFEGCIGNVLAPQVDLQSCLQEACIFRPFTLQTCFEVSEKYITMFAYKADILT